MAEDGDLHPRFGELCIELAKQGEFPAAWSVAIGISKSTFRSWRKRYPRFKAQTDQARGFLQALMEQKAFKALDTNMFQGTVWKTLMIAHFPEEYTPRQINENTNRDGDRSDLDKLTDDELSAEMEKLEAQRKQRAAAAATLAERKAARAKEAGDDGA